MALLALMLHSSACLFGNSDPTDGAGADMSGSFDVDAQLECTPGEEDCACDAGMCEEGLACDGDVCVPTDPPVPLCEADERVLGGACEACAPGTVNEAGDDPTGEDTECDAVQCAEDEFVEDNACVVCDPGTTRAAGDDASGADTQCEPEVCGQDEFVQDNQCTPCAPGSTRRAGDEAAGADTQCATTVCFADQRVSNNQCVPCPPGTSRRAGDEATSEDTECTPELCAADEFVQDNACVACPGGSANEPGDDASGPDTACIGFCQQGEFVQGGVCTPCPTGTTRAAGDDPTGPDTMCEASLCEADEFVENNTCTACPMGTTNAAGDDSAGQDTECEDACSVVFGRFCFDLEPTYVKASNTDPGDQFGQRVVVSGNIMAVTAREERSNATGVNGNQMDNSLLSAGAVYVFERNPTGIWNQTAYLKPPNMTLRDGFGSALAISGNTIVAGALFEDSSATGVNGSPNNEGNRNSGAAYVFVRDAQGTWSQQAYLKASNAGSRDVFGISADIDGDTIVIGANQEDSNATGVGGDQANNSAGESGAAYVFTRDALGVWTQQAYLKASNTAGGDDFGRVVAVDGDTIAVGASNEDSGATGVGGDETSNTASSSGAVYVFTRNAAGVWAQQAYVKASNTGAEDRFGSGVDLDGDTLIVSAPREDSDATGVDGDGTNDLAEDSGAVYVFTRDALGVWSQQAYIKASNTSEDDEFGAHIALSGDRIAVGSRFEDGSATGFAGVSDDLASNAGAVYVFERDMTGAWSEVAYLKASNAQAGDEFGIVALDGAQLVCGALREGSNATGIGGNQLDDSMPGAGAVYVYELGP